MCGIAGFVNFQQDFLTDTGKWTNILTSMANCLEKRGPDAKGYLIKRKYGFGHRRLSIRDLTNGGQPMTYTQGEFNYSLCYNGEVYNTEELKRDLEWKGYTFKTTCDTEVILLGLIHYGEEFIPKLNGIFSFAFWDDKKQKLLLVRDRVGIKPLFYTIQDGYLIFGSEIKAILQFSGFTPSLDREGLCEIFGLGPARTAGVGVFHNLHDVEPGHYISFRETGAKQIKYWDLVSNEHTDNYEDTVAHVKELVESSIKYQMISDVPVCSFLSGGVDSSVVTALSAQYLKEKTGEKLQTFSFDFSGNDKYFESNDFQPDQDRPWVEKVVKHVGTNHTFLECNNQILADYLYKAVDAKDLPGMADVDASLLYFCQEVAKTHKVTLTGECADEIFGGYPWFHKKEMFESQSFPWSNNLQTRQELLKDELIQDLPLADYVQTRYWNTINKVPVLTSESKEEKRRRELAYLNIKWFMATLLDRMDRTSMYSSLEARVPFADHRIIDYVFNVPWEIKYKDNTVKHLLRKASEGLLPDEILYRRKSPYPKTYNPEYEIILKGRIREIMADSNEPIHNFLDKKKVKQFLTIPSNNVKPWYGQLMAGPQMLAYVLQINYWMKKNNIKLL